MNTALVYNTRVVHEGGRRCKKSSLNDLVHLTPLRIPLMNPPTNPVSSLVKICTLWRTTCCRYAADVQARMRAAHVLQVSQLIGQLIG
jgi:hypothetical protein